MPPVRKTTALWKCVVLTCETDVRKEKAHRIPKNVNEANLWVKSLGNPELSNLGIAELNKYRVCHRHFCSTDYLAQTQKPTLKKAAIPNLRLPLSAVENGGDSSVNEFPRNSEDRRIIVLETELAEQSITPSSYQGDEPVTKSKEGESVTKSKEGEPISVSRKRKRPLGSHLSGVPKRERYLIKKARGLRSAVTIYKKRALTYRDRLQQAMKLCKDRSLEAFAAKLTKKQFIFFRMQLKNNGVSPRGRRFTLEEKLLSLSWMKASGRGYRLLQSQFQLPSVRTLTSLLNRYPLDAGISKKVIRALKNKVDSLKDPQNKFVTLMWDEVKLDANLQYDRKLDKIVGFEDWGNRRTSTIADHALVFMVRGIKNNWKMPLSFTFCASQTTTALLINLIKSHVQLLKEVGLTLVNTVCDQGSSNVAAINQLEEQYRRFKAKKGLANDSTQIMLSGMKIIPIFDPPHLLKCLRNNLLNKHLEVEPSEQVVGERHFAKWSHLELLHDLDLYAETDNQRLWRMTKSHVDRRSIKKMKVKYAAQVFSRTCATFLAMAARYGCMTSAGNRMPKEALHTSKLLVFINDLFDSVNGSSNVGERITDLRSTVTLTSKHRLFWADAQKKLQKMRFVNMDSLRPVRTIPCLANWNRTLDGFQRIWKRLLVEENFSSFSPRNMNQDSLENYFGSIRSHGWRNVSPSCKQFTAAYQSLVVNSISIPHSRGGNCEDDQGNMLGDLRCMVEDQNVNHEPDVGSMDDLPLPLENSPQSSSLPSIFSNTMTSHAASYVAQILLRHVNNCEQCKECIMAGNSLSLLFSDSQLHHVNSVFLASVNHCNQLLKSLLPSHCFRRKLLATLYSKLYENEFAIWSTCPKHASAMKSKFLEVLILLQVHAFCSNVNRILTGKYDRALYNENFVYRQARTYRFKHSRHRNSL